MEQQKETGIGSSQVNSPPDIAKLNSEVMQLRQKLNGLNEVKESWFQKKEEISKRIIALIGSVRSSKEARNIKTKEARQTKDERNRINDIIKQKIGELNALNSEKEKVLSKLGIKADLSRIACQIEALELKIQTDVMDFDKEKSLNKKIKELKKQMAEGKAVSAVLDKISAKRKELDGLREKAEEKHKIVQAKASESQEKHESLLGASKEIDELKTKEEEAYKEFFKYKEQFVALNNELKEKLKLLGEAGFKVEAEKRARKAKKDEEIKKTLKEKERDVEEKIKKKQKLTTEDLLVFQGNN